MAQTTSIQTGLTEDQPHNWKLLEAFQRELKPRLAHAAASEPSAPERQLTRGAYLTISLTATSLFRRAIGTGSHNLDKGMETWESDSSGKIPVPPFPCLNLSCPSRDEFLNREHH